MRLGLLIKDTEYRNALVKRLAVYNKDLFVDIIGASDPVGSDCLILTDIAPEKLDKDLLVSLSCRTVFLSSIPGVSASYAAPSADPVMNCRRVFKYDGVVGILSEASLLYNEWRGGSSKRYYSASTIAVITESDAWSSDKCLTLARQMLYRQGGSILVISLGYFNDYGTEDKLNMNRFARLLYSIRTGRSSDSDCFTFTDSYGIHYLMLPAGRNPAAYLEEEELRRLIQGLSERFDILILDIGSCFRRENICLMKDADNILFFECGRRAAALDEMIGSEFSDRVIRLKPGGDTDEAFIIDDCISKIHGNRDN